MIDKRLTIPKAGYLNYQVDYLEVTEDDLKTRISIGETKWDVVSPEPRSSGGVPVKVYGLYRWDFEPRSIMKCQFNITGEERVSISPLSYIDGAIMWNCPHYNDNCNAVYRQYGIASKERGGDWCYQIRDAQESDYPENICRVVRNVECSNSSVGSGIIRRSGSYTKIFIALVVVCQVLPWLAAI